MISSLFYFFLALLLLVTFHEYGHFQVARWCGVKVLRFSFGFGKILWRFRDKKGTEYVWSLFPLGGYVKMLDENEGPVAEVERPLAFNRQVMWKKVLIVLAGPVFNFIFAFFAFWLVAVIGVHSLSARIDQVVPGSMSDLAGIQGKQQVLAIDEKPVRSWREFQFQFMPYLGSKQTVRISLKSLETGERTTVSLPLANWHLDKQDPDVLKSLGWEPMVPKIPPVIGGFDETGAASQSDLKMGDLIVQMDGKQVDDWMAIVNYVQDRPNQTLRLQILRNQEQIPITLTIGSKEMNGNTKGYLGLKSKEMKWDKDWLQLHRSNPFEAIGVAFNQTVKVTGSTFVMIGRLLTGRIDIQHISGPVGIAKGAGDSGRGGLVYYLSFLAFISISLGVLNLLPIPLLDGGHLLFYAIEGVRRKPLTDGFKSAAIYMGLVFIIVLMTVALVNDIGRLV